MLQPRVTALVLHCNTVTALCFHSDVTALCFHSGVTALCFHSDVTALPLKLLLGVWGTNMYDWGPALGKAGFDKMKREKFGTKQDLFKKKC